MALRNALSLSGIANDASSFAATIIRLGGGTSRSAAAASPPRLLELYDYEGCPYCRKVRERLCELDLDVLVHPVAHGSRRRADLEQLGGRIQVPYLVDPNTGTALYESEDILAYLDDRYSSNGAGWGLRRLPLLNTLDSFLASAVRLARGTRVAPGLEGARRPASHLELYNMEGSPYCRKVREALTELDLEYVVRNVPKGSPKRDAFRTLAGKVQVPYLVDPNTGEALFESDDIVAYLHRRYGPGTGAARRGPAFAGR
jgi:glutathione S-transferase